MRAAQRRLGSEPGADCGAPDTRRSCACWGASKPRVKWNIELSRVAAIPVATQPVHGTTFCHNPAAATRLVKFSHSYPGLAPRAHSAPPLRGYFDHDLEILFHSLSFPDCGTASLRAGRRATRDGLAGWTS